ncbi:MAG: hypothetical protein Kow0062_04430 [Acidobacteriota bacterium]
MLAGVASAQAASVKSIILAEVDPGGENGTVVSFYDELTPEQKAQFASNFDDGQGYFISPVATVTWTADGIQYTETTKIFIVPVDGGAVVVPMSVTCSHSGCANACSPDGCTPTGEGKNVSCSGATCSGTECGSQNPTCSKTSSTAKTSFLMFGSV